MKTPPASPYLHSAPKADLCSYLYSLVFLLIFIINVHAEDINYEEAKAREKLVRHDVMSHVYAYGLQCPSAKGLHEACLCSRRAFRAEKLK